MASSHHRTRQSIAHPPSHSEMLLETDQENEVAGNLTTTVLDLRQAPAKSTRSRSKSMGPGGLDALLETAGNRRKSALVAPPKKSILKPSLPLSPLRPIPTRKPPSTPVEGKSPAKSPISESKKLDLAAKVVAKSPSRSPRSPWTSASHRGAEVEHAVVDEPSGVFDNEEAREARRKQREMIQRQREERRKSMANRRVSFAPEATLHTWTNIDVPENTTSSTSPNSTRRASGLSHFSPRPQRRSSVGSNEESDRSSSPSSEPEVVEESPAEARRLSEERRRRRDSVRQLIDTANANSVWSSDSAGSDSDDGQTNTVGEPMILDEDITPQPQSMQKQRETGSPTTIDQSPYLNARNKSPFEKYPNMSPTRDADISMDMTRPLGGIMQFGTKNQSSPSADATMDFTRPVGKIRSCNMAQEDKSALDENEDMSMEFTTVFGGIQKTGAQGTIQNSRKPHTPEENSVVGENMDMTRAVGGILSRTRQSPHHAEDTGMSFDMDITRAIGGIISNPSVWDTPKLMKLGGRTQPSSSNHSPFQSTAASRARRSITASANGSPSLIHAKQNMIPNVKERVLLAETPSRSPSTPVKQMTPQPARPTTPSKTPPVKELSARLYSPKKLFQNEVESKQPLSESPVKTRRQSISPAKSPKLGVTPQLKAKRRVSGIGFDKEGMGSPQVAALLDRRTSIGDKADLFAPQDFSTRRARFEDPRSLDAEVNRDREQEERLECGQQILEDEVNEDAGVATERDPTLTLKEAISNMTPKANKFKGRKSLAVGSARGLLGKRPAELDDDEDDGTPKHLRGRQASPVKKVRLTGPPSKSDTMTKAVQLRQSLSEVTNEQKRTPVTGDQSKENSATTPHSQGRFKDVQTEPIPLVGESTALIAIGGASDNTQERIHLQDFLKMTNIRFMELNTTKRRHTVVPKTHPNRNLEGSEEGVGDESNSFASSVVAGACTIPMLELYQHSCRELKKYIAEGRDIVREIENATYEENPQLFREYVAASPAERSVMDNQFKNMKTHARLLSKGMWYEWRMKLLEGLKEGLISEANGMKADGEIFTEQERLLEQYLPTLHTQYAEAKIVHEALQTQANDLAESNADELAEARRRLAELNHGVASRQQLLEERQQQLEEMDSTIEDIQDAKVEHLQAIREAQRLIDENRGWSSSDVRALQDEVDALKTASGWSIVTASSAQMILVYRDELQVDMHTSFLEQNPAPDPELSGSLIKFDLAKAVNPTRHIAKRFFLRSIQAFTGELEARNIHATDVLQFASSAWDEATAACEEIDRLSIPFITHCNTSAQDTLEARTTVLLPDVETKVVATLKFNASCNVDGMQVQVNPEVEVVYGEKYKSDRMADFLKSTLAKHIGAFGEGTVVNALSELKKRLVAQGRKT